MKLKGLLLLKKRKSRVVESASPVTEDALELPDSTKDYKLDLRVKVLLARWAMGDYDVSCLQLSSSEIFPSAANGKIVEW